MEITIDDYLDILQEVEEQPAWRHIADKEMDYADGNQLDSELLRKQQELGIPPAIEDVISPVIASIQGYEAATRTDWRVTPDGDEGGVEVADALNYRLNQAERKSGADRACSAAFRSQVACGIGWVEVSREDDPFKFAYRCFSIPRNDIYWDMTANNYDLSDANWLIRRRWADKDTLKLNFPDSADVIDSITSHESGYLHMRINAGLADTELNNSWNAERGNLIALEKWSKDDGKELCLTEVWYRRKESVVLFKTPSGRVIQYDEDNVKHNTAIVSGIVKPFRATVNKMRCAFFVGAVKLQDTESPFSHNNFPYVPFFGFKEDLTGVPYGYVRGMKYAQDNLNSGNSKLRWGMSVVRVERTKGAVLMTDAQLRRQVARADSDIILDEAHMRSPGARFDVKRDYQLSAQHYQMLNDARATIQRVSSISSGFLGKTGTATSGLQEQMQIEQSNQALGGMMDNFRISRSMVGEILLSMIIEDIGREQTTVNIKGDLINPDKQITLNVPMLDDETGIKYLNNDVSAVRLKVALEDVPSTTSYRVQQLNAMSEAVKSLPSEYQSAMLPFMVALMDIPSKDKVLEAINRVAEIPTEEQMQERINQAVNEALVKSGYELKMKELEIKEAKTASEIKQLDARSVQVGVQAAYSAMQSGAQIAQMPQIAKIADKVMEGAGYVRPDVHSDYQIQMHNGLQSVPPMQMPETGNHAMTGIETQTVADNLQ